MVDFERVRQTVEQNYGPKLAASWDKFILMRNPMTPETLAEIFPGYHQFAKAQRPGLHGLVYVHQGNEAQEHLRSLHESEAIHIVLSGPSAGGATSVAREMADTYPLVRQTVSITDRPPQRQREEEAHAKVLGFNGLKTAQQIETYIGETAGARMQTGENRGYIHVTDTVFTALSNNGMMAEETHLTWGPRMGTPRVCIQAAATYASYPVSVVDQAGVKSFTEHAANYAQEVPPVVAIALVPNMVPCDLFSRIQLKRNGDELNTRAADVIVDMAAPAGEYTLAPDNQPITYHALLLNPLDSRGKPVLAAQALYRFAEGLRVKGLKQ